LKKYFDGASNIEIIP